GSQPAAENVRFPAARTFVGTDKPELVADGEGPKRPIRLRGFALELEAVSNARFAGFVAATGYVTEAERFGWSAVFRGLLAPETAVANSAPGLPWWVRVDGAAW